MTDSLYLEPWNSRCWKCVRRWGHGCWDGCGVKLLALPWSSTRSRRRTGRWELCQGAMCSPWCCQTPNEHLHGVTGCSIWSIQVQGWTAPSQSSWGQEQSPLLWWSCGYGFYWLSYSAAVPKCRAAWQLPPNAPGNIICRPYYPFSHFLSLHFNILVSSYVHLDLLSNQQLPSNYIFPTDNKFGVSDTVIWIIFTWCDIPSTVTWLW